MALCSRVEYAVRAYATDAAGNGLIVFALTLPDGYRQRRPPELPFDR